MKRGAFLLIVLIISMPGISARTFDAMESLVPADAELFVKSDRIDKVLARAVPFSIQSLSKRNIRDIAGPVMDYLQAGGIDIYSSASLKSCNIDIRRPVGYARCGVDNGIKRYVFFIPILNSATAVDTFSEIVNRVRAKEGRMFRYPVKFAGEEGAIYSIDRTINATVIEGYLAVSNSRELLVESHSLHKSQRGSLAMDPEYALWEKMVPGDAIAAGYIPFFGTRSGDGFSSYIVTLHKSEMLLTVSRYDRESTRLRHAADHYPLGFHMEGAVSSFWRGANNLPLVDVTRPLPASLLELVTEVDPALRSLVEDEREKITWQYVQGGGESAVVLFLEAKSSVSASVKDLVNTWKKNKKGITRKGRRVILYKKKKAVAAFTPGKKYHTLAVGAVPLVEKSTRYLLSRDDSLLLNGMAKKSTVAQYLAFLGITNPMLKSLAADVEQFEIRSFRQRTGITTQFKYIFKRPAVQ